MAARDTSGYDAERLPKQYCYLTLGMECSGFAGAIFWYGRRIAELPVNGGRGERHERKPAPELGFFRAARHSRLPPGAHLPRAGRPHRLCELRGAALDGLGGRKMG